MDTPTISAACHLAIRCFFTAAGIFIYICGKCEVPRSMQETKIHIRKYEPADCAELTKLFYDTVHTVNAKDYSKEQLDVWADGSPDLDAWNRSLTEHYSLVAVCNGTLVGFGDIDRTGYLDRLFVHKEYQHRGIAAALCDELEQAVKGTITTHASITARPFFLKRGYQVIKEQEVERKGVFLTNYVMEKSR